MATGIVSIAAQVFGLEAFSIFLLAVGTIGYLILIALHGLRMLTAADAMRDEARSPGMAFGFYTFVAASNVLAARYVAAGDIGPALVLALAGGLSWLLITYTIPLGLMLGSKDMRLGSSVNGSWLMWAVATQSVSIAASLLAAAGLDQALLRLAAAVFWAIGAMLYIVLITIITARMLLAGMSATELTPAYWINMGATSICVLAGARLLASPLPGGLGQMAPVVTGVSFILWAYGSSWIPALVLLGIWRYRRGRHPAAYEPGLWSMVFPLGMYVTATDLFGRAERLPWLVWLARDLSYAAYAAWAIIFVLMLWHLAPRRLKGLPQLLHPAETSERP